MDIEIDSKNMPILECFSSETRVKIMELLNDEPRSINELAEALGLSSAIVTKHIQKLEEAGIIRTESISGKRGRRKVCHLLHETITLRFKSTKPSEENVYTVSIPVGQYTDYEVHPTCGLASETGMIGMVDDPRYFSSPDHVKAKHIWFGSGFVQYRIPNYLVGRQQLRELQLSFEICSEAPDYNEQWPSDIYFSLNGVELGMWTCPGDFGRHRGVLTPSWWTVGTQHGLLKTLTVGQDGTYLDGQRLSGVTPTDLGIQVGKDFAFQIANPETAVHRGGVNLFGSRFGNYDQEIEVAVRYAPAP
ncbi:ArsR/SmtB family transcription factor [Paenibacillus soyae]|uniref:ArsR family transcriptional regulator n=1 Tax=Paenibacillus soyae TaxID=2969249 RepID=A0A9X2S8C2_9BACL|nr:ArsR family transcriptional regulator [Paenibacillus soyae]MCR2803916.1 ArsR family transcriptional regulator [Paenibacillus soyae]